MASQADIIRGRTWCPFPFYYSPKIGIETLLPDTSRESTSRDIFVTSVAPRCFLLHR